MKLKNLVFLPDLVLRALARIPAPVFHNLDKARALKLVFWHLALDGIEGCYVEFGVASGNSMRSAELNERFAQSKSLGVQKINRNLYGFDTFSGFESAKKDDVHPTWKGDNFSVPRKRVERRFAAVKERVKFFEINASNLGLVDGFRSVSQVLPKENSVAIALFDMDLAEPTAAALEWVYPLLRSGSIVIFDEFLAYSGNPTQGEAGVWREFLIRHPKLSAREYLRYGDGGVVFQITISN